MLYICKTETTHAGVASSRQSSIVKSKVDESIRISISISILVQIKIAKIKITDPQNINQIHFSIRKVSEVENRNIFIALKGNDRQKKTHTHTHCKFVPLKI